MASVPEMTNEGTSTPGEPFVCPSYGNIGPPHIATLSLPGLTIGLPVWLFSTQVIPNAVSASVVSTSPQEHQPHVDPSPSSPIRSSSPSTLAMSPSISSSSSSESSEASNSVNKKKKKRKNKKKKDKQGSKPPTTVKHVGKQPVTVNHAGSVDDVKITQTTRKPKYPCRLCKGSHLLKDCPGLSKVIEVWSTHPRQPMSSASEQHADDLPSTSHDTVGKKKSRVKFPCMLCKGSHLTHLCPRMEEASKLLEDMTISQPQLPAAYRKLSLNPPVVDGMITPVPSPVNPVDHVVNLVTSLVEPVDKVVDPIPSSVNPTLPLESETKAVDLIPSSVDPTLPLESVTQVVDPFTPVDPILPLENETQVVDLISPSVDPTLPLESKPDTAHVFLVDTDSAVSGGIPPSPIEPPPSNEAIRFDWDVLTGPRLPSYIPFQITVQVCGRDVTKTLIDEGSSVSILSSIAWQALGCPPLAPVTQNLLAFNRRTSQPLGTLPQFPVTLGGKTVFIDVMVVQDPLDFSLLLGRDYVYAMKAIVSTLFHVISFPHDGRVVTVDQLSFIDPAWIASLNGSCMQTVSPPPQVNYVALSPMASTSDDLDPVVDMVISSIGLLEPDLFTPVATLDMVSFQSVFLPSSEDLLEAMTEFCPLTWCHSGALSSWNP
jgi:hypothetical protein